MLLYRVNLAAEDFQGNEAFLEWLVYQEKWAEMENQEPGVYLERMESLVPMEGLVSLEKLVKRVNLVFLAKLAYLAYLEEQGYLARVSDTATCCTTSYSFLNRWAARRRRSTRSTRP